MLSASVATTCHHATVSRYHWLWPLCCAFLPPPPWAPAGGGRQAVTVLLMSRLTSHFAVGGTLAQSADPPRLHGPALGLSTWREADTDLPQSSPGPPESVPGGGRRQDLAGAPTPSPPSQNHCFMGLHLENSKIHLLGSSRWWPQSMKPKWSTLVSIGPELLSGRRPQTQRTLLFLHGCSFTLPALGRLCSLLPNKHPASQPPAPAACCQVPPGQ